MSERDELDRLLDVGLASYSDCEPLAGIEERVLRRVAGSRRRPWLWWLAAAVPVAACLVVMTANREVVAPVPVMPTANIRPAPVVYPPVVTAKDTRRAQATKSDRLRHFAIKRNRFPTEAPLTAQERGLLELAATAPDALLVKPAVAIEIEPIQIKPLDLNGTN